MVSWVIRDKEKYDNWMNLNLSKIIINITIIKISDIISLWGQKCSPGWLIEKLGIVLHEEFSIDRYHQSLLSSLVRLYVPFEYRDSTTSGPSHSV